MLHVKKRKILDKKTRATVPAPTFSSVWGYFFLGFLGNWLPVYVWSVFLVFGRVPRARILETVVRNWPPEAS